MKLWQPETPWTYVTHIYADLAIRPVWRFFVAGEVPPQGIPHNLATTTMHVLRIDSILEDCKPDIARREEVVEWAIEGEDLYAMRERIAKNPHRSAFGKAALDPKLRPLMDITLAVRRACDAQGSPLRHDGYNLRTNEKGIAFRPLIVRKEYAA